MNNKTLIAFTGKKGHGKSTACDFIERIYQNAQRINFKDGLVAEMRERLPDTLYTLATLLSSTEKYKDDPLTVDDLFNIKPPVMRELMQNYGTEVRRRDDPGYWTNKWQVAFRNSQAGIVLNDDTRFLNEAQAIKANDGYIVRIIRTGVEEEQSSHQSETEMDQIDVDYTIYASNIEELEQCLNEFLATRRI